MKFFACDTPFVSAARSLPFLHKALRNVMAKFQQFIAANFLRQILSGSVQTLYR